MRLVHNTLERLVSTDFNRAQAFGTAAAQQAWRARHGTPSVNYRTYPGLQTPVETTTAPVSAEVYSGLLVRPDADTDGQYLTVDPGLAMILDPTGGGSFNAGDSPYLQCDDPGVSSPGVLNFTPNAVAATVRWDVVECQPTDVVLEQSSRDVYNPATGLFTPALVDKVRAVRLTYRIRQGSAGGGFPGGAAGWLPLAVVAVYNGFSTGFDKCDFWDVRPLVEDRVGGQSLAKVGPSLPGETHCQFDGTTASGYSEGEFAGYRAGGAIRTGSVVPTPGSNFGAGVLATGGDAPALSYAAWNQSTISVPSGLHKPIYVGAFFPKPPSGQSLIPRWVRYSQTADVTFGRRVPRGPRGILLYTTTPPLSNGTWDESVALPAPSAMQFGAALVGVRLFAGAFTAAGPLTGTGAGRKWRHSALFLDFVSAGVPYKLEALSLVGASAIWALSDGVDYPRRARSLLVGFQLELTSTSVFGARIKVVGAVSGVVYSSVNTYFVPSDTTDVYWIPPVEVPLPPANYGDGGTHGYPPAAASFGESLLIELNMPTAAPETFVPGGATTLMLHGWEL